MTAYDQNYTNYQKSADWMNVAYSGMNMFVNGGADPYSMMSMGGSIFSLLTGGNCGFGGYGYGGCGSFGSLTGIGMYGNGGYSFGSFGGYGGYGGTYGGYSNMNMYNGNMGFSATNMYGGTYYDRDLTTSELVVGGLNAALGVAVMGACSAIGSASPKTPLSLSDKTLNKEINSVDGNIVSRLFGENKDAQKALSTFRKTQKQFINHKCTAEDVKFAYEQMLGYEEYIKNTKYGTLLESAEQWCENKNIDLS